jgi:hypothetical protein
VSEVRPVDLARLALGTVALARPQLLVRATGSADGPWPRRVTRLLGARYVVQSTGGMVVRDRWVPEVDAAVDLAHALTTLGFAKIFPRHRRLALTSGAVAVAFGVADLTERVR